MMNLQTQLAPFHKRGLLLQNPVVIASGTFGYGIDDAKIPEVHSLGAITCKGTTLRPRSGNEQPRTMATASGMLNAIGLQNPRHTYSHRPICSNLGDMADSCHRQHRR